MSKYEDYTEDIAASMGMTPGKSTAVRFIHRTLRWLDENPHARPMATNLERLEWVLWHGSGPLAHKGRNEIKEIAKWLDLYDVEAPDFEKQYADEDEA